jgi:hypothetical protein
MKQCLFCSKEGPYTQVEHIIPESLGNDDLLLIGEVCDKCNQYFGKEIEAFILEKTPIAFWRTFLGIKTKKGRLPHIDLSQPKQQKGRFAVVHPLHDNGVLFTCQKDYSVTVKCDEAKIPKRKGEYGHFTFVFTPFVLLTMGRFLCKVGIELLCCSDAFLARSEDYAEARRFARYGTIEGLWPIFHIDNGNLKSLIKRTPDRQGLVEEVFCYNAQLFSFLEQYMLLTLTVGTDVWIIGLNDPYPTRDIAAAFPGRALRCLWYPHQMLANRAEDCK